MKPFQHFNAATLEEARILLRGYGGKVCLMAGGTDLLGVLKDRILPEYPDALINLKTIPGMDFINKGPDGLRVGAMTTLSEIACSPLIKEEYAALSQAAHSVASPEIRNMGTIGGNLCQDVRCWYYRYPHQLGGRMLCLRKGAGPCHAIKGENRYHALLGAKKCFAVCPSDTAIALSALQASIEILGAKGTRSIAVEHFFAPLGNALGPEEVVKEIRVPPPSPDCRQSFLKFAERTPVDFAVVSVASAVTVRNGMCVKARLFLGGVAPMPWRAEAAEQRILGRILDEATANEAAHVSVEGARPLSGNAYKIEIVRTLIKRALLPAAALQQTLSGA
jgi:xanthine dehydrogenase YagS FAD-binding subunit